MLVEVWDECYKTTKFINTDHVIYITRGAFVGVKLTEDQSIELSQESVNKLIEAMTHE